MGATKDLSVDARVIAATHRDLFSMVQEGSFREDLYYRLRGFLIRTPSLGNHENDIRLLAQILWRKTTNDDTSTLPQEIIDKLQTYSWPGNARELKNVLSLLDGLFGKKRLGRQHLEAIFSLEGHGSKGEKEAVSGKEMSRHPAECLRHLKRVDEAVHAAKATLHPLVEGHKIDEQTVTYVEAALRFHLNELEILCQDPSLFNSEFFSTAYTFKGKLTYFQSLLPKEIERACTYWKDEVAEEFNVVLSEILKEQRRLIDEASKRP